MKQATVLVLYYSRGGRTAALAMQAARGVESAGAVARVRTVPPVVAAIAGELPPVPADGPPYAELADLSDADGLLLKAGCAYGAGRTRTDETLRFGAYLPHLGEGVDAEAANEVRCALQASLLGRSSSVVHAVSADATLARAVAARQCDPAPRR